MSDGKDSTVQKPEAEVKKRKAKYDGPLHYQPIADCFGYVYDGADKTCQLCCDRGRCEKYTERNVVLFENTPGVVFTPEKYTRYRYKKLSMHFADIPYPKVQLADRKFLFVFTGKYRCENMAKIRDVFGLKGCVDDKNIFQIYRTQFGIYTIRYVYPLNLPKDVSDSVRLESCVCLMTLVVRPGIALTKDVKA